MSRSSFDWIREAWSRAWNEGDVAALDTLLAPEYVRHEGTRGLVGRDQYKQRVLALRESFPDTESVIEDIFGEGDRVAIRWTSTGTHEQEYLGMPGTGRTVVVDGISIGRVRSGLIVEEWVTWDPREMLSVIGIFPLEARR